jgi:hypothetical protein
LNLPVKFTRRAVFDHWLRREYGVLFDPPTDTEKQDARRILRAGRMGDGDFLYLEAQKILDGQ